MSGSGMTGRAKARWACAAMAVLASALASGQAMAAGFYIQEQSAKGAGRAYSGEVADQGAESLWWNPAAIGGLQGGSSAISATAILPRANVADNGTIIVRPGQAPAAVGGDAVTANPINDGVVPSGAIAHSIGHRMAVGLAITAPFNFTTAYPASSWTRYTATTTRLRTIDVQPSLAVELAPGFSLGAAINIERVSATLANALPNLAASLPDGSQSLSGTGWDVGYSLGVQYHRGPLSLGVSYKSAITHTLSGTLAISGLLGPLAGNNQTTATTARFTTPWQVAVGARYAVTRQLTLNATVTRFGWSEFGQITLGAPVNAAVPENYRDTWNYAAGFDYELTPKWTLRAGIQRDMTPVRGDQRDSRVPDANRWVFAVGASHALTRRFTIDAAFNYLALDTVPINRLSAAYAGTTAQTPILVNGSVNDGHVFIASVGGRMRF